MKKTDVFLLLLSAVLVLSACLKKTVYYACCTTSHSKWVGKEYKVPRLHGADSYYQNAKNEAEQHGHDLHGVVKTANICSVNK